MTSRLQCRRTKGWRKPEGAVYVGRPSWWGNPYRARLDHGRPVVELCLRGEWVVVSAKATLDQAKRYAVRLFREGLTEAQKAEARHVLRGHDLMCWCKPGEPCHGDVLLEIANG